MTKDLAAFPEILSSASGQSETMHAVSYVRKHVARSQTEVGELSAGGTLLLSDVAYFILCGCSTF